MIILTQILSNKEIEDHSDEIYYIRWQPTAFIFHQDCIQVIFSTWNTTILCKLQEQLSTFFLDKCHQEHSFLMNLVAARETGFINSWLKWMIFGNIVL